MPMHFRVFEDDPRFQAFHQRVGGRPGWVWKTAALAAVLVVVVPLVLLTLAAAVVGIAVFVVLSAIAVIARAFRDVFAGGGDRTPTRAERGDDQRENVRIIERP